MENKFRVTDDLLATTGQRFGNYIIDVIVIYIFVFIIAFAAAMITALAGSTTNILEEMEGDWLATLIFLFISTTYYVIFEGFFSRSIAKFITQTVVVNEDGSKPDFGTIFKRTLCRIIPFDAFSYLGGRSRGWHDSIPEVYVVKKQAFEHSKKLFDSFEEIGKTDASN